MDALATTLLDIDTELGGGAGLSVGGGYGLFLKQQFLTARPSIRTRFAINSLPIARSTADIDLFLRAEVVADADRMATIRSALDRLGFVVVDSARYMQFVRQTPRGIVKVDLLVGPLGEFAHAVRTTDGRRARPGRKGVGLHARWVEEAIAVDRDAFSVELSGYLTAGAARTTTIQVPQPFSYLMMKLMAFRDRLNDRDKNEGRHHALDAYRIIGMMTEPEDSIVQRISREFGDHPRVVEARQIVADYFQDEDSLGLLRIREHPLFTPAMRLHEFRAELQAIFPNRG